MNIAAFDLSLTATGYAHRARTAVCNEYGVWTPPASFASGMPRLAWIRDRVLELADVADLVVLEGYAYGRIQRAHPMGELGGVVRLALYDRRLLFVDIPPACLKKYATGKGNVKKEAVLAAAIRRLDYPGHDHNEADALWLLHMTLDAYSEPLVEMPKAHREALEKVAWPLFGTRTQEEE